MSAPALDATMPAQAAPEPVGTVAWSPIRTIPATPVSSDQETPEHPSGSADTDARLIVANQRADELEEQLVAAGQLVGRLIARNRELADALDQLAEVAVRAEQERLIRPSRSDAGSALADWAGGSALSDRAEGGYER
ncbi:hypothetical protein AB0L82_26140 [Nocardia sp. NPDC052001]|uniref:hypothetical protein n=1 Tax=Nocardia sp. NPDC052001 TaxID=3154853 RepID=UPI0034390622